MKIAFFYSLIIRGGVETALRNLLQRLTVLDADIYVVYTNAKSDPEMLREISQYAKVVTELPYADIVVECSIFEWSDIMAGHRIHWIHGNAQEHGVTWKSRINADKYISVSEEAKRQFGRGEVLLNELDDRIYDLADEPIEWNYSGLRLVTVSRVSQLKGFERMPALCRELEAQSIDYEWIVVGGAFYQGYMDQVKKDLKHHNVRFIGQKPNPYPYLKAADFCVQLSDMESFGLSTMEGQVLGTPSIITDYTVANETLQGHALILDKDMGNVSDIVSQIKQGIRPKTRTYKGDADKWIELLQGIEVEHDMIVEVIKRYYDVELNKKMMPGAKFECTPKRAKQLMNVKHNDNTIQVVRIIEQATQKRIQEGTVEKRKAVRSR